MRGLYSIYLDNFYLNCYVLFIVYRKVINLVPVNIVAKLKMLELIIFCTHVARELILFIFLSRIMGIQVERIAVNSLDCDTFILICSI